MCCRTMKIKLQHPCRTGKWLKIHLKGREHYILKELKEYWELFVCLLWGKKKWCLTCLYIIQEWWCPACFVSHRVPGTLTLNISSSKICTHLPTPSFSTSIVLLERWQFLLLWRSDSEGLVQSPRVPTQSLFGYLYSSWFLRWVSLYLSQAWISTQTLEIVKTPKLFRPEDTRVCSFLLFYLLFLLDAGSKEALDPTATVHCESCHLFWKSILLL